MAAPKTTRKILAIAATLAILFVLEFGLEMAIPDSSLSGLLLMTACNVLVAVSLNIINGMAGQFSIGHAGFVGMGAYAAAIVVSHLHEMLGGGTPTFAHSFLVVPVALLVAATVSGVFGFLLGLPSLRLKGDYLAIVTLGFAEIFRLLIMGAPSQHGETVGMAFGKVGHEGLLGPLSHALSVSLSSLGGQNGYSGPNDAGLPQYAGPFWVFGVVALMCVFAWRLKFSGWGRALRALREDEIAAAAVGVDPTRYKVQSFVLSAIGAGVAGGLLATMRNGTPSVQPDTFNFQASFDAITMVILGGSGSVTGAVLGGVFVTLSIKAIEFGQGTEFIQDLPKMAEGACSSYAPSLHAYWHYLPSLDLNALRMILYASVLITLMILRPEGLLGERELFAKRPGNAA